MASYPQNYHLYATLSGSRVEITGDAIQNDIVGEWGINGTSALDNMASTGAMSFTLNNRAGKYLPESISTLSGWKKGVRIELVIRFDNVDYKRFVGTLDRINLNDDETVDVTVLDWMDYAAKYPLNTPSTVLEKTADEAINMILANMPRPPQNKNLDTGNVTFPVVFDSTTIRTKAYSEFNKLVNSELGKLYLQHDKNTGEKLVFENNLHRYGLSQLELIPRASDDYYQVTNSTGGYVLDSGGSLILFESYDEDMAVFDNNMTDISLTYGEGMINQMTVTAHPKTYDTVTTGSKVLFSLSEPVYIAPAQTVTFFGKYTEPRTGKQINALTSAMIPPVATTDYKANRLKDGTGTNLTSYLSGSTTFSTAQAQFSYTDTSGSGMWITQMNLRGYGIYSYNPIEAIESDMPSIEAYDYQNVTLDQPYQTDLIEGREQIEKIVEYEKTPRKKITDVSFIANTSDFLMMSFLYSDVGSLVRIIDDENDIDGLFYIQKVKFKIRIGGIIVFTWTVKEEFTLALGLSLVESHFTFDSNDAINFEYLPQVTNLPQITYSAWVKRDTLNEPNRAGIIIGHLSDYAGVGIYVGTGNTKLNVQIKCTSQGVWATPTGLLNGDGAWNHVLVTIDKPTVTPTVYINGVNQPLLEDPVHSGNVRDETGVPLVIGNELTATIPMNLPFNGTIKDVRIYNRILSSVEIENLYNGINIDSGLVFQAPTVRTGELDDYDNLTLDESTKVLDSIYGAVGTANDLVVTTIPE